MGWLQTLPILWLVGSFSFSLAKVMHIKKSSMHKFHTRANGTMTRMEAVKTMYGFQGFVYSIDVSFFINGSRHLINHQHITVMSLKRSGRK